MLQVEHVIFWPLRRPLVDPSAALRLTSLASATATAHTHFPCSAVIQCVVWVCLGSCRLVMFSVVFSSFVFRVSCSSVLFCSSSISLCQSHSTSNFELNFGSCLGVSLLGLFSGHLVVVSFLGLHTFGSTTSGVYFEALHVSTVRRVLPLSGGGTLCSFFGPGMRSSVRGHARSLRNFTSATTTL